MGECRVCEVNCLRETEQSKVVIQRTIVWVLKFPAICEDEVEDKISEGGEILPISLDDSSIRGIVTLN